MSTTSQNRRIWKKPVNWLSRRVPPMGTPFFPAIFATLFIFIAWMALPQVLDFVLSNDFWSQVLAKTNGREAVIIVFRIVQVSGSFIVLCLFARCLELFWPAYFDPFRDKHH